MLNLKGSSKGVTELSFWMSVLKGLSDILSVVVRDGLMVLTVEEFKIGIVYFRDLFDFIFVG